MIFDYEAWDPTTESVPQRGGMGSIEEVSHPFSPNFLMDVSSTRGASEGLAAHG